MEKGDLPAWIALLFSTISLIAQAVSSHRRKARDEAAGKLSRLEAIERILVETKATAIAYWLHSESVSAKDGLMLTHHLKDLASEVERNKALLWPEARSDVLKMKMRVTGSDFQSVNRPARPACDPLIREFSDSSSAFLEKLKHTSERYRY